MFQYANILSNTFPVSIYNQNCYSHPRDEQENCGNEPLAVSTEATQRVTETETNAGLGL